MLLPSSAPGNPHPSQVKKYNPFELDCYYVFLEGVALLLPKVGYLFLVQKPEGALFGYIPSYYLKEKTTTYIF